MTSECQTERESAGNEPTAGFPWKYCPETLPDLSQHNNIMAEVLREKPELYAKYKDAKTSLGVTLAKCIKTGVDNPGHPFIMTVGCVAGDEESYVVFKEFFDQVEYLSLYL